MQERLNLIRLNEEELATLAEKLRDDEVTLAANENDELLISQNGKFVPALSKELADSFDKHIANDEIHFIDDEKMTMHKELEFLQGKITTQSFTLPLSAWIISYKFPNLPYQADINISGLNEDDLVQVILDTQSCIYANDARVLPSVETSSDTISLYAYAIPADNLTGICIINKGGSV